MSKIAVFGGTSKFFEFLKLTGAEVEKVETVAEAIGNYNYDAMIVLPSYEEGKEKVETFDLETIAVFAKRKREGFRLYIENYNSFDMYNGCVFGCEVKGGINHIIKETLCAKGDLRYLSKDGIILQAEGAAYFKCWAHSNDPYVKDLTEHKVLITKGEYIGTSFPLPKEEERDNTLLLKTGSFITSVFSMTNFNRISFKLNSRWKRIFGYVFAYILGAEKKVVEDAFQKVFYTVKTRMDIDSAIPESDLKSAYERAVKDAVNWHFDSGVVLGDGTNGSVEMIMSSNGQGLYNNKRVESGMYTGWLLCDAGKHFGREDWVQTGKNIFNYFSKNGQLSSGGPYDGLYRFYYNENSGPNDIYTLDCGRDGIALCNMYRLTGNKEYLERIKRLAEGLLRWTDEDLLRTAYMIFTEPYSGTLFSDFIGGRTPAACMEMTSFMVMASKLLGDDKYLDKMVKIADRLVRDYPSYDYHGHTTSSRMARFLFLLLIIQHTGKRDFSNLINELIDYLYELKMDCGGIYSEDNLTFEKFYGKPGSHEAGITTVWESDRISDQLYCVNNTLMALSLIKKLPENTNINKQKGMDLYNSLLKYIVKIQIVDDDKRFNGGWMRAYSMTHKEYYGLNLDYTWGPYCIMAGWIMGILPLTLLSELTDEDFYI